MPSNENGVGSNGNAAASRPYPPGIHVPSLTFFDSSTRQELDPETQTKHITFLAKSGIHGIVLAGTNGEAIALSRKEKVDLTRLAKKVVSHAGKPDLPITVGTSGISTRDVIDDSVAVKEAGADFALILVPSFFHFAMTKDAICEFYEEVADASPIPVLIYNFPNVTAGLNVDSPMLDRLAKHSNIVGVKLTCGSIAKVTRVSAAFSPKQFSALAGQSDWLIPALSVGGTGCITGVGNLYPKSCVAVYDLYMAGKFEEAQKLQYTLGVSELGFGDGGINGTKWVVSELLGYPEEARHCRRPYPRFTSKDKQKWILDQVRTLESEEARLNKSSA
ncbi:hypothetical protein LTR78_006677 [Recurvomyces mirabilis]|uniref:Uncharacterized protein n=1 Tax=Recurvomyces mirabilis TaxID=574656 RepID=A0AAE0WKM8_9PEZI|nr:hypothetical protein LTR78_006677 [Recurvomyces mirabilis]KAK5151434.1 hypothetical protein LTS14_009277 [Recurvomyces mirabilis]